MLFEPFEPHIEPYDSGFEPKAFKSSFDTLKKYHRDPRRRAAATIYEIIRSSNFPRAPSLQGGA
ncbi:hypothetical protein R6Q59_023601 [Mikania micrantha]